ncbi:MAG: hypothetical protein JOZ96_20960 [Acidobacteria bacterium]|nr:hypothetical protein [Acidobacteriota bacterium]
MSESVRRTRGQRADPTQPHTPRPDSARRPDDKLARREGPDSSHLLDRILNTPRIERVIPRLPPALLHRVIRACGLEDCGDLVALATPGQLERVFDLDLWGTVRPGSDEQFDAGRFGVWLEVLAQSGPAAAAQKLAGMDLDLVVAGLAQHLLVYDLAAVTPYETSDGELVDASLDVGDRLAADLGGYVLVARREDSWGAIVELLAALDAEYPDFFHKVMGGCRALSDSGREIDGLDELLSEGEQFMFDLAADRERRREMQGYATPAQARAFLEMSRGLRPAGQPAPPANPLARAYFRAIDEREEADNQSESLPWEAGSEASPVSGDASEDVAKVFDVLLKAGVIEQQPRALLGGSEGHAPRLGRIDTCMRFVFERDEAVYSRRNEELAYLANTLMAGCAIGGRPFTAQEASDAAAAVCNLGLENWPPHWLAADANAQPGSFLLHHDLVGVFQVGWAVLYQEVCLYAAEQLVGVLSHVRCDDRETQTGLDALHIRMEKCLKAGAPWRACGALDVIATLDTPVWAALLALIDEFPVLHACVCAFKDSRTLSVNASDFEFISENSQVVSVRDFMRLLPETLRR